MPWGIIFILISAVIFFGTIGRIIHRFRNRQRDRSDLLKFAVVMVVLTLIALKIGCAIIYKTENIETSLHASSFFVEIMQMFSLDADYGDYLALLTVFDQPWAFLCGLYLFLVLTAAPLVGGFFFIEILAGISPRLKLFLYRKRPMYIFSELNEKAITLAEDICRQKSDERLAIVFTDAYSSDDEEEPSELLARAKELGAICLRDDLLHLKSLKKTARAHFLLMDEAPDDDFDNESNVTTLYRLLNPSSEEAVSWNRETGCQIYIFCNDPESTENIRSIKRDFDNREKAARDAAGGGSKLEEDLRAVKVHVIREFTQTSAWHLKDHPLFDALPEPELVLPEAGDALPDPKPLRVVIFGNNAFSREMFKTIFWCGQMLGSKLNITVVYPPADRDASSRPSGPAFAEYLNRLSPEIIQSCVTSTEEAPNECLRIFPGTEAGAPARFSPPYCGLSFIELDPARTSIGELLSLSCDCMFETYGVDAPYALYDCDYFLIMHGGDQENISIAGSLFRALLHRQIETDQRRAVPQIISVAIRDEDMGEILRKQYEESGESLRDSHQVVVPRMIPFASLQERYSWRRTYLSTLRSSTFSEVYSNAEKVSEQEHPSADIVKESDIYNEWSSFDRNFHRPYKARSALLLASRGCDAETQTQQLAWLEHRRWNAYIRAMGFTVPFRSVSEVVTRYAAPDKPIPRIFGAKDVPLHLHPCLVEAAPERMTPNILFQPGETSVEFSDTESFDALDWISVARSVRDGRPQDVKKYDIKYVLPFIKPSKMNVRKKECVVQAFRLGDNSELEETLIAEGRLIRHKDGAYEVFSREAKDGAGERCAAGDYIKLDANGDPYPNKKEFFEENHRQEANGEYIQRAREAAAWQYGLALSEEIEFLLRTGRLRIDPADEERFFRAELFGAPLSAAKDAVVVFYSVSRAGAGGEITDIEFNFVTKDIFEKTYEIIDG